MFQVCALRGEGAGLSLEDSRKLLQQSGKDAQASSEGPKQHADQPILADGLVRCMPLGTDRDRHRFWQLRGYPTAMQG